MKRPYEITVVLRILSNEDETQAAINQIVAWIENKRSGETSGTITRIDRTRLGRRKLAYEIDGQRDGLYIIIHADIEPAHMHELDLNLKLYNPVLRFLVIRDESKPEDEKAAKPRRAVAAAPAPVAVAAEAAPAAVAAPDEEDIPPADDASDTDAE
jgi:small subunit ribosomal protein S6